MSSDRSPHQGCAVPAVLALTEVQRDLGVKVEFYPAAIASEARRLKMGEAAIAAIMFTSTPDTVVATKDGNSGLTFGAQHGEQAWIFMGSVLAAIPWLRNNHQGDEPFDLEFALSKLVSSTTEHELRHLADNANVGRAKLEREDKRYERWRITKAASPVIAASFGLFAMAGSYLAFAANLGNQPWWSMALVAGGASYSLGRMARSALEIRSKVKAHNYRDGEKSYLNHPIEKRARRTQAGYDRRLKMGRAPLLAQVIVVDFTKVLSSIDNPQPKV